MITIQRAKRFLTLTGVCLGGLLLMATQTGCLVAAAAAGTAATVAYVRGDTEALVEGTPPQVAAAAERAVRDLDLAVVKSTSTGLDGNVTARTSDDTRIEISIRGESSRTSRVWVRAGVFGNSATQQRVLDKMKAHLATEIQANTQ